MENKKLIYKLSRDMAKICLKADGADCFKKSCFICLARSLIELGYRKPLYEDSNVSKD